DIDKELDSKELTNDRRRQLLQTKKTETDTLNQGFIDLMTRASNLSELTKVGSDVLVITEELDKFIKATKSWFAKFMALLREIISFMKCNHENHCNQRADAVDLAKNMKNKMEIELKTQLTGQMSKPKDLGLNIAGPSIKSKTIDIIE